MRRWTFGLGGLLIWFVHFAGLYAIASVEAQTRADDAGAWKLVAITFSVACAGASVAVLTTAIGRLGRRGDPAAALMTQLAALGAGLGLIAIVWQSAAAVI
jgi:hypothetical protein